MKNKTKVFFVVLSALLIFAVLLVVPVSLMINFGPVAGAILTAVFGTVAFSIAMAVVIGLKLGKKLRQVGKIITKASQDK